MQIGVDEAWEVEVVVGTPVWPSCNEHTDHFGVDQDVMVDRKTNLEEYEGHLQIQVLAAKGVQEVETAVGEEVEETVLSIGDIPGSFSAASAYHPNSAGTEILDSSTRHCDGRLVDEQLQGWWNLQ